MRDGENINQQNTISNLINDAVIADANASQIFFALQLLTTVRARVKRQFFNRIQNAALSLF